MEKPKCKQCEEKGLRYIVNMPMGGMTTLLAYTPGYWDEEGEYHQNKNPNITTYTCTCSNGHTFTYVYR